jgi:N-acetylglutamate synthase-like GNAT family acetyltransferase
MTDQLTIRPATERDSRSIVDLVHRVRINPAGLDWRRFVVAVDGSGKMLGCGQLKPHGADVIELASIAVVPSNRKQGVARAIIEHLLSTAPRPVYLTCRSGLKTFYEKWGFRVLEMDEMPTYFRRLVRFVKVMLVFERGESMLVMKLQ